MAHTTLTNLNKENFFNALMESNPKATKEFCDWIDKYKETVNWQHLFATGPRRDFKFHHLPFDMQIGILLRYIEEKEGQMSLDEFRDYMVTNISAYFNEREKEVDG